MMYNDMYNPNSIFSFSGSVDSTWMIVSAVLAIVGGIVAYALFVMKKNEFTGFLKWLHDFLNFKTFLIEKVLKVLYMVVAIFITLSSFSFIKVSIASFFMYLVLGNIIARILYEFILMFLTIVSNTTEINKKLSEKKENNTKTKKKED